MADPSKAGPQSADPEPASKGPPDRTEADFARMWDPAMRAHALREYQRTLEAFRQTGTLEDKTWDDYARFNHPQNVRAAVFMGYGDAWQDIRGWQAEQAKRGRAASSSFAFRIRLSAGRQPG